MESAQEKQQRGNAAWSAENRRKFALYLLSYLPDWKGYRPRNCKMGWQKNTEFPAALMKDFEVKDNETVEGYLDTMEREGVISLGYHANPYKTRFRHHFKMGLGFSLSQMKAEGYDSPEDFIKHLFREQEKKPHDGLRLIDAEVLIGSPYTVMLTILTDAGIDPLYQFEKKFLSAFPAISTITTWTVAYSHCWSE